VDDAIKHESDDDLYEPRPGPRPSEIRAAWARAGDVESLWNVLVNTPWDRIDREAVFKQLLQALEVRGRSDTELFAAEVFERMTTFVAWLLLRSHLHLATSLEGHGRAVRMRAQPPGDLPAVAVESLIPRTLQLQEHLATLLLTQASVARQWTLIRKNRNKGDHAEAPSPGEVRRHRRSKRPRGGPADADTHGLAADRLAGQRNGQACPEGARHDD
jgi:hypothetical protein